MSQGRALFPSPLWERVPSEARRVRVCLRGERW
jgi:hypothetical protein